MALPAAPTRHYTERTPEPCNTAEGGDITVSGLFTSASQPVVAAWPARSQEGAAFWEKGKPKHAASLGEELSLAKVCKLMRSRSNLAGLESARERVLQDQALVFCLIQQQLAPGLLSLLSCCWCFLFARAWLPARTLPRTYTAYAAGIKN